MPGAFLRSGARGSRRGRQWHRHEFAIAGAVELDRKSAGKQIAAVDRRHGLRLRPDETAGSVHGVARPANASFRSHR